jgi:hypothetical protein
MMYSQGLKRLLMNKSVAQFLLASSTARVAVVPQGTMAFSTYNAGVVNNDK